MTSWHRPVSAGSERRFQRDDRHTGGWDHRVSPRAAGLARKNSGSSEHSSSPAADDGPRVTRGWSGSQDAAAPRCTGRPGATYPFPLTLVREPDASCRMGGSPAQATITFENPLEDHPGPPSGDDDVSPRAPVRLGATRRAGSSDTVGEAQLVMPDMSLHEMFTVIDPDGSGALDAGELRDFAQLLGVRLTEEQAAAIIRSKSDAHASEQFGLKLSRFEDLLVPALLESQDVRQKSLDDEQAALETAGRLIPEQYERLSLGRLGLDNCLRVCLIKLVQRPAFDNFILLLICMNAMMLAMEDPLRVERAQLTKQEQQMAVAELFFVRIHP